MVAVARKVGVFLHGPKSESSSRHWIVSTFYIEGASEWHHDGKLCYEWLTNLERGRFTDRRCDLIRRIVMKHQADHLNHFDTGELIRLDVSISRTLPQTKGFLRIASAAVGPIRGKVTFGDEYGDGILKQ